MMKHKLSLLCTLALAFALVLTACGKDGNTPSASATDTLSEEPAIIENGAEASDVSAEPVETVLGNLLMPYNWKLWDGTYLDFSDILVIESGYGQDPVTIEYDLDTLKAVDENFATIILRADGGLQNGYHHENNLGIAPYAFAWSTSETAASDDPIEFGGYKFRALNWFLAGEFVDGESHTANLLNVNEAIDRMIRAVDIYGDGTPDSERELILKAYLETKRLEPGKTYYFFARRYGGNALFAESGFHPGDPNKDGVKTEPVNFVSSEITISEPLTIPVELP